MIRIAVLAVLALVLTGCTPQRVVVEDSRIAIAVEQELSTLNPATRFAARGSADANAMIAHATRSSFYYYDDAPKAIADESFGRAELVSEDPLVVRFTIADGVTWSDGAKVDAADMLLAWAAESGALNDPDATSADVIDPETGAIVDGFPEDRVWFDAAHSNGLELVTSTPEMSDDRRSITMRFDEPFVDWRFAMNIDVPAHVVAAGALGATDRPKDAVIDAIQTNDTDSLAKLARFWNVGFAVTGVPDAPVLVSSGPYVVTSIDGKVVTLAANPTYSGIRMPHVETIEVRVLTDGTAAVDALVDGSVQVIAPQPSVDVVDALAAAPRGITALTGSDATFEHIDLQFEQSRNGHFDDSRVREAFLKVVPRQEIIDTLIRPVQPDAVVRESNLLIPGSPGYAAAVKANGSSGYDRVDVAGAARLLTEAGVEAPEVCILYAEDNPRRTAEFALIKESAARAGFVVTDCSSPDWIDLLGVPGRYDAALFGWQAIGLGVTGAALQYATEAPNNVNYYSSSTVDKRLAELASTFDEKKQRSLLAAVDTELFDDAYGLPLFQYPRLVAVDETRVNRVTLTPLPPGASWNMWEWEPVEAH